ncbi:MAG TPA: histidine kinase [Steroidobacteraceae bacterium]|nr:histidine kinase [Steroidobacteraceae bacterium]
MEIPLKKGTSYNWLWIASLWAGLAILDATQNVFAMRHAGMHHAWLKLFIYQTFAWLPWGLATPLIIHLGRRFPLDWKSAQNWLAHVAAIVVIEAASTAWASLLEGLLQPWLPDFASQAFFETWPQKFSGNLLAAFIIYALILAATYALDSRARAAAQRTDAARLNEQLSYARLNALQRQIEPHFIFNTLNAIAGLVREHKNDAAVGMIVGLSDFLRRVAASSGEPKVQLEQEVEFLSRYMQIQEARFAGRLKLELDIPPELHKAQIPSLMLQPLVENAIKHGIAKRAQGGVVRVAASRSGDELRLSVYNDGPLLDRDGQAIQDGIGLANLRTRLSLLYGNRVELRLENCGITGVEVSVVLPYRET